MGVDDAPDADAERRPRELDEGEHNAIAIHADPVGVNLSEGERPVRIMEGCDELSSAI